MTAEGLLSRLRRKPFVPFRIHLSGGTFFDVFHPKMMLISKNGVTIAIYEQGQGPQEVPARDVLVSYLHITTVEDLPAKSLAG